MYLGKVKSNFKYIMLVLCRGYTFFRVSSTDEVLVNNDVFHL